MYAQNKKGVNCFCQSSQIHALSQSPILQLAVLTGLHYSVGNSTGYHILLSFCLIHVNYFNFE